MRFKKHSLNVVLIALLGCTSINCFAEQPAGLLPCLDQPEKQAARAFELQQLEEADQNDRTNLESMNEEERADLFEKDLVRRKRVGEILGEGCFKTAEDYIAASLIYQHGDSPDHFFQAFIWAMRAVQLGEKKYTSFVSLTVDRYLVSIGKKQLFGSQAWASDASKGCYCLEPVESSFPDSFRKKYSGASLQERLDWIASLNQGKGCSETECSSPRPKEPSPPGTVPGLW